MSLGDPGFGEEVEPGWGEGHGGLTLTPQFPCQAHLPRMALTSKVRGHENPRPGPSWRGEPGHRSCPPQTTNPLPREHFILVPSAEA